MTAEFSAFSLDDVVSLTGLTKHQLRYWDESGLFCPSFNVDGRRVYSFRDLVGLRALAGIRKRLSLQAIRKFSEELNRSYESPWSSLKFLFAGDELAYQEPWSLQILSAKYPGQEIIPIDLEAVRGTTITAVNRRAESSREVGKVVRMRDVMRNKPVLAGTRVTTRAVYEFHQDGYSVEEILSQYPGLTAEDVRAAVRWEETHSRKVG